MTESDAVEANALILSMTVDDWLLISLSHTQFQTSCVSQ